MISVVIPAYRNTELLEKNLTLNLPLLHGCDEIVVVNDDPYTSIAKEMKHFADVTLLENSKNLGFAGAVHRGIMHTRSPLVMLLNSDVELIDRSYMHAPDLFSQDTNLFAVSFSQIGNNNVHSGKNRIYWKNGYLLHAKANDRTKGITAWAEGGSCILQRQLYIRLGGFRSIYSPFYWEDVDLSYRAWKSGYTVLFEPSIQVKHEHEATIGSYFRSEKIKEIALRNQLLCTWCNITDTSFRIDHIAHLVHQILSAPIKNRMFLRSFASAAARFVLHQEKHTHLPIARTDHEVLALFEK